MIQKVLSGLGALLLSGVAGAQSLSVPSNIASGETIDIKYENAARANENVIVTVRINGAWDPYTLDVAITLDRDGKGSVTWTVPDGVSATFNAPSVRQVSRFL